MSHSLPCFHSGCTPHTLASFKIHLLSNELQLGPHTLVPRPHLPATVVISQRECRTACGFWEGAFAWSPGTMYTFMMAMLSIPKTHTSTVFCLCVQHCNSSSVGQDGQLHPFSCCDPLQDLELIYIPTKLKNNSTTPATAALGPGCVVQG